tara:strand:- start:24 stop:401 length:378 start_codon:yes stop_codon:yes gene_type:complete
MQQLYEKDNLEDNLEDKGEDNLEDKGEDNLEIRLKDIRNLYKLIDKIEHNNKKNLLKYKMQTEIDFMIDRIEEYYYKYILKNKKVDKILNEADHIIYTSRKTMDKFLPYMLLYNMTEGNQYNQNI